LKEIIPKDQNINVMETMLLFGNGITGDFSTNGEVLKGIILILKLTKTIKEITS
jgi:hypothetical protein